MSFEVKITAASLGELADKVLALGAQLSAQSAPWVTGSPVMPEVKESMGRAKKLAEKAMEKAAAGAAASEDGVALNSVAHPDSGEPVPEEAEINEASLETVEIEVAEAATPATFDFGKDVAPRVLAVVGNKGKATMQEILREFSVERASQITNPVVVAEFIEVLDKELAG